jgi:hypothetical protein
VIGSGVISSPHKTHFIVGFPCKGFGGGGVA